MPNPAADLEEALKKKGGLTLTQLANYDDLITDALVDRVYFWSTIRKLRANYHPCRGVQEEKVCDILRKEVVVHKDTSKAQDSLLDLPGLSKYHKSLRTADEKEHFVRHLRKYTNMYLPDCPFEVGTTNRYTITTAEASIIARKPIRKGEPIKYLSGIQVEMTEKEEKELCSRTDFSIVLSSRRKRPSLFLGPARFANHDCDSNAKLNTTGPHGIHIVARKDIIPGEEITVTYGLDYFGEDNCECLCATCEGLSRNGWDPRGPIINESSDDESEDDEVDDHGSQVTNDTASSQQNSTPVPSKKRKREVEELCAEPVGQTKRKRGRGRPRKCARPRAVKPQAVDPHDSSDSDDSNDSDDSRPSERETPVYSDDIRPSERKYPVYVYTHPDDMHAVSQHSSKPTRSVNGKTEDTVNRIRQLLRNVAEREGRTGGNSESENTSNSSSGTQTPQSNIDVPSGRRKSSGHNNVSTVSSTRMDQTARSMRNRDSSQISRRENMSKLPSINKERNYSRLRNVMNADDTKDPFSIPPSPQPLSEFSTRGRGRRLRKCTTEGEVGEQKSLSPSSVGNDSASPVSASSSATSLDIFAAGSIAENICEMFTTGIKQEVGIEDEEEEEKVVPEPPRRMSTRTSTRLQMEKSSKERKETVTPSLSPAKVEKDREPLRRSIRTSQNGALSPLVRSIEKTDNPVKHDEDEDSSDVERGPARTPGDYTLCKILLATPYHRWVECRNCDEFFVQSEAYLTRIACPRCERHSKLYGYYWPKTDREGKNDVEVRVTDHRTIHRFIDPEEERSERKGRRTLASVLKEKELSERLESEESDKGESKRLRVSPRRSESRRKLRSTM